jgi:hypothetical protein
MGKKAKAPPPIDPKETARAATGTNISTAIANTAMGNVNQIGPESSLTYSQTGTQKITDPYTGEVREVPTYTAETKLNAPQQALYDSNLANRSSMSAKAGELLGGLDSTGDIRGRVEQALMARLNPQLERDRAALETRLANQGLTMGSRAYSASQDDFSRGSNDARLSAILAAGDEERATRSQRLNEIGALQSGGTQQVPQYSINRPAQAATVDTAGLINTQQQQQMQVYQQQQANRQGILGGLFGIGSAGILALSDRRLKTDIEKVEERPGPDVYDYRYKTDPKGTKRRGYMAQEVQKTRPDAVRKMGKYLAVDYSKLPAVR